MRNNTMGDGGGQLEALLKRDRAVVIAALVAGIVMSWTYLVSGAGMSMSAFEMSSLAVAFGARDETSMGMAMLGVGCCWALMAVLFFGGVMNLYWILGLAVLVLVEKVLPVGPRAGSVIGVLLAVWGGALMLSVAI